MSVLVNEDKTPMPATPDNKTKIEAAVRRWVEEARGRTNGGDLLRRKADLVERMMGEMSRLAARNADMPADLVGLTIFDLTEAHARLLKAAGEWEAWKAEKLAAFRAQCEAA